MCVLQSCFQSKTTSMRSNKIDCSCGDNAALVQYLQHICFWIRRSALQPCGTKASLVQPGLGFTKWPTPKKVPTPWNKMKQAKTTLNTDHGTRRQSAMSALTLLIWVKVPENADLGPSPHSLQFCPVLPRDRHRMGEKLAVEIGRWRLDEGTVALRLV